MNLQTNAQLKRLYTFGIQAEAPYLASCSNITEVQEILEFRDKNNIPLLILGGGSNILFTKNPHYLVLLNRFRGIELLDDAGDDHILLKVAAGENWHEFVVYCIKNNLGGLENLSLIPGNVGASPMQNIGAYGVEIKDCFHSLEAIRLSDGTIKTFNAIECNFGYRESVFKNEEKNKWLIVSVIFKLSRKNHILHTGYGAILSELEQAGIKHPGIADISEAVIRIRKSKLPDPAQIGNAGSFFKNPVVSKQTFETIRDTFPDVVAYPAGNTEFKLAAGWLIEKAGWKGYREGDAGVHQKQALVLVNYGNASGQEIVNLSTKIIDDIQLKFNVLLEREVNII
jgi:UDP-N-acetylmuramate dehydrogenase